MGFGVFIHRPDSIYDDSPAKRYQFPKQYLSRAETCVGDWVVYYEPRKVVGTKGYFAVAKVQQIIPDPSAADMYLAIIEPGSYLDFPNPVPFADDQGVIEKGILNDMGRMSGRAQAAVRPLSNSDFNQIVKLGLGEDDVLPRLGAVDQTPGFAEEQAPFEHQDQARDRVSYIASRAVRNRIFRKVVLRAYDNRCAISGLKLINGGGRAEAEAAHIQPVAEDGPDIINNGLALSGTVHWMFDRGLISLSDDLEVLISRQVNDTGTIRALINENGRALFPVRQSDRPLPRFLEWHRSNCFKG